MTHWSQPAIESPAHVGVRQVSRSDVEARVPLSVVQRLLEYVRLVGRLMLDHRVSYVDRLVVLAALAYVISPLDLIPDVIPFVGQVDDVILLVSALTRLFEHARRDVVLSHWRGSEAELDASWLRKLALVFAVFFPKASRQRLRRFARG